MGAGTLGSYTINSNTFIRKFADHVVKDRPESLPAESASRTVLEPLRRLDVTREVEGLGLRTGPLPTVGRFLSQGTGCTRRLLPSLG